MRTLTCPYPSNVNPLQSNGFLFNIHKLPELTYWCQDVTLPGIDLPPAIQETPLSTGYYPGDKPIFGDLFIEFLIDENMSNYKACFDWIKGMGFPQSNTDFSSFLSSRTDDLNGDTHRALVSDATLQILNSSNNAIRTIQFQDVFPSSLQQIQLQSTTSETTYLAASATFRYTLYDIR